MKRIGFIGFGLRISGIWDIVKRQAPDFQIVAICDPKKEKLIPSLKERNEDVDNIVFYDDAEEMLQKANLDGILIGTRCSMHTKYAKLVLKYNIPLFLEKPISTNYEDYLSLKEAGKGKEDNVVVSFPLRMTPLVQATRQIIEAGTIGTPEHLYAWNNPNYADCYYQDWYRDENETQGLWLQKATHDFDYINYILGYEPKMICAMMSKQIFKGNKPAGLKCVDCDEFDTCPQGPKQKYLVANEIKSIPKRGDFEAFPKYCCFAVDTGNEDSGSALIKYNTGMHASYTQCFFARKDAGNRGCRVTGYDGAIEFDWYTDEVKIYHHRKPKVEVIKSDSSAASHGGGDDILAASFIDIVCGTGKSCSTLKDGLLSVLMCLKAKESCLTNTFQEINF